MAVTSSSGNGTQHQTPESVLTLAEFFLWVGGAPPERPDLASSIIRVQCHALRTYCKDRKPPRKGVPSNTWL
jgi:hypothetical protein